LDVDFGKKYIAQELCKFPPCSNRTYKDIERAFVWLVKHIRKAEESPQEFHLRLAMFSDAKAKAVVGGDLFDFNIKIAELDEKDEEDGEMKYECTYEYGLHSCYQ
jgi:hypothetical protein